MLAWLWRTFVRWRNSQNQRKIIQIATDWWMQASEMEPQEVHTLEGLRNLARSSMRGLRQVKVIGTFEVEVPIEFTTTGILYDFEDCILVARNYPALVCRGAMNCYSSLVIDTDRPVEETFVPFEVLQEGQDPSGNCVIAGYANTGSAFLDLQVVNSNQIFDYLRNELGLSDSCSVDEEEAREGLLE